MKNILLTITVVLLQIATANSKNNNTTYIKLSIGDCGTCTNVLHNPKVFLEYTDSVVVMLPQKYKNNTGKVLELFPELTNDIFRVRYTDTLLNGMENGTTSYIYKYEDGVCIKKMPLKFFTPNEFYGKKQQSTRLSISKIDTTKTTNTSPLEMYDVFLTANGTIFAIDVLDNILVYKPFDINEWRLVDGSKLRRMVMARLFPSENIDTAIARQDELLKGEKMLEAKKANPLFIADKNDTTYALYEFVVSNNEVYGNYYFIFPIYHNSILHPIYIPDSTSNLLSAIAKANGLDIKKIYSQEDYKKYKISYDSLQIEYKYLHSVYPDGLYVKNSKAFFITNYPLQTVIKHPSASAANDSFIALHTFANKGELGYGLLLKLTRPRVFSDNKLGTHLSTLAGKYPFIMFQVTNTLYDLEHERAYDLPISMGNYDFSPAVMKNYTPKMGLYICDVISQGNKVRVLYSYADKNGEYNIMEYDVSTQKIANQGSFTDKSIGTTLTNENILRFNGYNTIVNITKGSDKIITYTISE